MATLPCPPPPPPKIIIISPTGYTYAIFIYAVIPILVALRADQGVWPPYASMMLIELYSTASGFSVRIVYNGDVVLPPFCGTTVDGLCDYKKFSGYMATVTPNSNTNCSPESPKQRKWKWY